jgi:hypothetical protein
MKGVQMKIKEYDLNVYVVDGVARLSAYQYQYSDHPTNPEPISTKMDNDSWITLSLPLEPMYHEEMSYLLGDKDWQSQDWQDYDSPWESVEWLDCDEAPATLRAWVNGLPEYEPEVVHDWGDHNLDFPRGSILAVPCKNCDATYDVRRLSFDEMNGLGI